jgi:hypothetical protein
MWKQHKIEKKNTTQREVILSTIISPGFPQSLLLSLHIINPTTTLVPQIEVPEDLNIILSVNRRPILLSEFLLQNTVTGKTN